jgi:hypothetical protein
VTHRRQLAVQAGNGSPGQHGQETQAGLKVPKSVELNIRSVWQGHARTLQQAYKLREDAATGKDSQPLLCNPRPPTPRPGKMNQHLLFNHWLTKPDPALQPLANKARPLPFHAQVQAPSSSRSITLRAAVINAQPGKTPSQSAVNCQHCGAAATATPPQDRRSCHACTCCHALKSAVTVTLHGCCKSVSNTKDRPQLQLSRLYLLPRFQVSCQLSTLRSCCNSHATATPPQNQFKPRRKTTVAVITPVSAATGSLLQPLLHCRQHPQATFCIPPQAARSRPPSAAASTAPLSTR